jgi:hypothetical protein
MKKALATLLIASMAFASLAACGGTTTSGTGTTEEAEEENYETGDASLDNPRNQDDIGENELLVVSFGTSFNDNRRNTIGAIEDALYLLNRIKGNVSPRLSSLCKHDFAYRQYSFGLIVLRQFA